MEAVLNYLFVPMRFKPYIHSIHEGGTDTSSMMKKTLCVCVCARARACFSLFACLLSCTRHGFITPIWLKLEYPKLPSFGN